MGNPLVSIVMAVRDGAAYLPETLRSISSQTLDDFECIVVNDGSRDGTADILRTWDDRRLRILDNEVSRGLAASLNRGIGEARGRFIARMDADDICRPQRLERQAGFMQAHHRVGVCGSWYRRFGADEEEYHPPRDHGRISATLLFRNAIGHPTAMFRRKVLDRTGIRYDERLHRSQDYALWVALRPYTRFANLPEVLVDYRCHERQISTAEREEQDHDADRVRLAQLHELGIYPTPREWQVHAAVCARTYGAFPYGEMEDWLEKILEANRRTAYLPRTAFRDFISRYYREICRAAGPQGDSAYARSRGRRLVYYRGIKKIRKLRGIPALLTAGSQAVSARIVAADGAVPPFWPGPPQVSVMVIVHNGAAYLKECLDSLTRQTLGQLEVLVVDDGSTDDSAAVCETCRAADPRIRLTRFPENRGINAARQHILEQAAGEYVAVLDADDVAEPRRLERQYLHLQTHPDTVLLGSYYRVIGPDGAPQGTRTMPRDPVALHWALTFGNCLGHSTTMYRRKEALACGGYNPDTAFGGDMEFYSRLIRYGHAEVLPEILAAWRRHGTNWTRARAKRDDFVRLTAASIERHLGLPAGPDVAAALFNNAMQPAASAEVFMRSLEIIRTAMLRYRVRYASVIMKTGLHGLAEAACAHLAALGRKNREQPWWNTVAEEWRTAFLLAAKVYGRLQVIRFLRTRHVVPSVKPNTLIRTVPVLCNRKEIRRLRSGGSNLEDDAVSFFLDATARLYRGRFRGADRLMERYRSQIRYERFETADNRPEQVPELSVVVVAYRTGPLLLECLDGLAEQTANGFEVIVVDNGGNDEVVPELLHRPLLYVKSPLNLILSEGRNIGVHFARGRIVAFLDDDALVRADYTSSILDAFTSYNVHGLRGRVLPKSDSPNNRNIGHYDLGDLPLPSNVDTEGNSAFLRESYQAMGGMNPLLFGHEGFELSYRLARRYGEHCTIYWPDTVIYHDYAVTDRKLTEKHRRTRLMTAYVRYRNPGIKAYRKRMKAYTENRASRLRGAEELEKVRRS